MSDLHDRSGDLDERRAVGRDGACSLLPVWGYVNVRRSFLVVR